jgi:hypothetical protein
LWRWNARRDTHNFSHCVVSFRTLYKERIKLVSVVFDFAWWETMWAECGSVVCVRNPIPDALYWLRAEGYKLFVFTNLTVGYKVLSLRAGQPLRGGGELEGWRCELHFIHPKPLTPVAAAKAYLCSELYHILQSNAVAAENSAKSRM